MTADLDRLVQQYRQQHNALMQYATRQRLREIRLQHGLDQGQLAHKMDSSRAYVSFVETGVNPVTIGYILKMSAALSGRNHSDEDQSRTSDSPPGNKASSSS